MGKVTRQVCVEAALLQIVSTEGKMVEKAVYLVLRPQQVSEIEGCVHTNQEEAEVTLRQL